MEREEAVEGAIYPSSSFCPSLLPPPFKVEPLLSAFFPLAEREEPYTG
jgi:hypothetical protein